MNRQTHDDAKMVEQESQTQENQVEQEGLPQEGLPTDTTNVYSESGAKNSSIDDSTIELFSPDETNNFHSQWESIQASFVDEPNQAVSKADELVADVVQRLTESFKGARSNLEKQWEHGDQVSTEDLRVTIQRYRSLFNRLLGTY
jgi:hypothetical protein